MTKKDTNLEREGQLHQPKHRGAEAADAPSLPIKKTSNNLCLLKKRHQL